MATRYWVGGSGNWNISLTTNWSASSGGAGGASVPGTADDVIFDANSNTGTGAFTVTITGTTASPARCRDFSTGGAGGALDGVMTLAFPASTATLDCYGSMTFPSSNFLLSTVAGANLRFRATTTGKTFTTNGVVVDNLDLSFDGVGGGWTLGSALSGTGLDISVDAGTFNTGNYNLTYDSLQSTGTDTRSILFGSSTVTSAGSPLDLTGSNYTFNAGTSSLVATTSSSVSISPSLPITLYDITFSNTAIVYGAILLLENITCRNFSIASQATLGCREIKLFSNLTVTGTLDIPAPAAGSFVARWAIISDSEGVQRTLTAAAVNLTNVDFQDIAAAGAATWSGTRLGDAGNNSGITFPAAKTVYYSAGSLAFTNASFWATSSGGGTSRDNFPLAQDTAIIDNNSGSGTLSIAGTYRYGTFDFSSRTSGMTLSFGNPWALCGDLTLSSGVTSVTVTTPSSDYLEFIGRSKTQNLNSAGVSLSVIELHINAPTATVTLTSNANFVLLELLLGTFNLNNNTLTCPNVDISTSGTRALAFGTSGQITLTGNNGTIWDGATLTGFTTSGTSNVVCNYSGATGTRTISHGSTAGGSESTAISFSISAGTDTVATTSTSYIKNFNLTGFSGTLTNTTRNLYGNLTIPATTTLTSGTSVTTFGATSGTQQITTNGRSLNFPLTFNGVGGTFQLQDALTSGSTRTATLTNGTLDLNNFTLTTGLFSSTNSNVRTLAFGTGNITLTGNAATIFTYGTATNLTVTGTSLVRSTYSGSTGTRTLTFATTGGTEANSINFNITAGSDIVSLGGTGGVAQDVNLTGFSGTIDLPSTKTFYGSLNFGSATAVSGTSIITFAATSGTKTIRTNSLTYGGAFVFNGVGGTWSLSDALTLTLTTTLTNGTLNLGGFAVSTSSFATGAGTKNITFNSSTLTVVGSGATAFNNANPTGFTTTAGTGTGVISMNSASAKTFVGGGSTYNCTLQNAGAGALTVTGNNTFTTISNSVQPTTFTFGSGSTQTVTNWSVNGTAGNLVTINATSTSQASLSKSSGVVTSNYLDLQYSNATGGATWYALNSLDSGNNTGWNGVGSSSSFLMLF